MKRLFTTFAAAVGLLTGIAAQANPVHVVKLNDGSKVSVEACSDEIFRVRYTPRKDFSESLMERYGIVKTDWSAVNAKVSEDKKTLTVKTATHVLTVSKADGVMKLSDASGKTVIKSFSVTPAGSKLSHKMSGIINKEFETLKVPSNGGIIGDDNGTLSEKDKYESGDPDKCCIINVALLDGERFYGGGSTSRDHIQHRGEILRMHATYQNTEIPMPFLMSSEGWGIYSNDTRKSFFDIGATDKDWLRIYNTFDEADFYVMAGGDMPKTLGDYTLVTGRPYVLPKWAYGLCFGPNMKENQFDILTDAFNFRQIQVPCDVFWLEPQWMEKRYDFSTQKTWNFDLFSPEPYWLRNKYPKQLHNRLFIGKLRSMGYHLGLWLCEEYDFSITEEDAIAAREGRPQSGQEHWMDHLKTFLDYGVEGFKMDPARTIDDHTYFKYYNGHADREMHNLNQVLLQKQMAQMGRSHTGKRTWHHYCGGWSGVQHWGASTSGDNGGGKTALFDQLNLGMSGFLNTSCDVMSVPRELEMQSLHFGLFLPWTQINSWFSMMQPFYYDEHEQGIYRDYVKLRYSLMPYIYSMALEGAFTGMPIVRSMPLVFPEDRNVDDMAYQYMFGNDFLLGIFTNEVYLPAGTWTDFWTGEQIVSKGETFTHEYPDNRAGLLFVREGAIIPMQPDVQYMRANPWKKIILNVFPAGETSYTMYEDDGESYAFEQGSYSTSVFGCKSSDAQTEITIAAVEGSFEGMPQARDYELRVCMASKPSQVCVNGSETSDWCYEDGRLMLTINAASVSEKHVVTIR